MQGNSWLTRVTGALGALLAIALVTRIAWALFQPAFTGLLVLFCLISIISMIFRRNRYW
jgi:hypothetical protein